MSALLLQRRAGACSGWSTNTQGVLAIRQPDPTIFDQASEGVPVKLIQSFRSIVNILELKIEGYKYLKQVNNEEKVPQQSTSVHCSSA